MSHAVRKARRSRPGQSAGTQPVERLLPRGVMVLVGVASSVVALAGIKAAAGIVTPVFIALLVVVAVEPLHRWGARHRLPRWLSALVALLGAYLLIVGLVVALMVTLGRFAGSLPGYASDLQNLLNALADRLRALGIGSEHAREILESFAPQQLLALLNRLLSDGFLLSSNLLLILTLLLFIAMDAVHLPAFVEEARTKHPGAPDTKWGKYGPSWLASEFQQHRVRCSDGHGTDSDSNPRRQQHRRHAIRAEPGPGPARDPMRVARRHWMRRLLSRPHPAH